MAPLSSAQGRDAREGRGDSPAVYNVQSSKRSNSDGSEETRRFSRPDATQSDDRQRVSSCSTVAPQDTSSAISGSFESATTNSVAPKSRATCLPFPIREKRKVLEWKIDNLNLENCRLTHTIASLKSQNKKQGEWIRTLVEQNKENEGDIRTLVEQNKENEEKAQISLEEERKNLEEARNYARKWEVEHDVATQRSVELQKTMDALIVEHADKVSKLKTVRDVLDKENAAIAARQEEMQQDHQNEIDALKGMLDEVAVKNDATLKQRDAEIAKHKDVIAELRFVQDKLTMDSVANLRKREEELRAEHATEISKLRTQQDQFASDYAANLKKREEELLAERKAEVAEMRTQQDQVASTLSQRDEEIVKMREELSDLRAAAEVKMANRDDIRTKRKEEVQRRRTGRIATNETTTPITSFRCRSVLPVATDAKS